MLQLLGQGQYFFLLIIAWFSCWKDIMDNDIMLPFIILFWNIIFYNKIMMYNSLYNFYFNLFYLITKEWSYDNYNAYVIYPKSWFRWKCCSRHRDFRTSSGGDPLCLIQLSSGDGTAHLLQFDRSKYDAPNFKKVLSNPN